MSLRMSESINMDELTPLLDGEEYSDFTSAASCARTLARRYRSQTGVSCISGTWRVFVSPFIAAVMQQYGEDYEYEFSGDSYDERIELEFAAQMMHAEDEARYRQQERAWIFHIGSVVSQRFHARRL